METGCGHVIAELFPDHAPVTVQNFLRYVDGGYYSNATFYRAVRRDNCDSRFPVFEVIQGGIDPLARRAPLPSIFHEGTDGTGLTHTDGTLSAVRYEPGTASSEFFIVIGDAPALDFGGSDFGSRGHPDTAGYAAFGRVLEGMDTIREINARETGSAQGLEYMRGQALIPVVPVRVSRFSEDAYPNARCNPTNK